MMDERAKPLDEGEIAVTIECARAIGLALEVNGVPVVRRLAITNPGDGILSDLTIRIGDERGVTVAVSLRVEPLAPGEGRVLEEPAVGLYAERLAAVTHRESDVLWIEVLDGERPLWREPFAIDLVPPFEWDATAWPPELLASWVMPDHPAVAAVLAAAQREVTRGADDDEPRGYSGRSAEHVTLVAASIYRRVRDLLDRRHPAPATEERAGEGPSPPLLSLSPGIDPDLAAAVIAAAAFERLELNPILVASTEGIHAGVWLEAGQMPSATTHDPDPIRKRCDAQKVLVFAASGMTREIPFTAAVDAAMTRLRRPEQFDWALDIWAARSVVVEELRVHPFPPELQDLGPVTGVFDAIAETSVDPGDVPHVSTPMPPVERPVLDTPKDAWRRRLLDLSGRNRLLNFRPTKLTVQVLAPDLPGLASALCNGGSFEIQPGLEPVAGDGADGGWPSRRSRAGTGRPVGGGPMRRSLHVGLSDDAVKGHLRAVYRAARTSIADGGSNTLYLSLGFLRWFDETRSGTWRRAPLLLIPVELVPGSSGKFELRWLPDPPAVNETLVKMLRGDEFGIRIPALPEPPAEDLGPYLEQLLLTFRRAIVDEERMEVDEEAWIGLFSFTKFLMFNDPVWHATPDETSDVIRHLFGDAEEGLDHDLPLPGEVDQRHADTLLCPLDADASQLAAVYAAAEGKSFVLQGPPGTGKSQTIANIIAHSMAHRRSVLFVSEKMAALEVVHKRLRGVGLGPFCLELHSSKIGKAVVARQLQAALQAHGAPPEEGWAEKTRQLEQERRQLNDMAAALHERRPVGQSVHEGVTRLIGLRGAPAFPIHPPNGGIDDVATLHRLRESLSKIVHTSDKVGDIASHPWRAARIVTMDPAKRPDHLESIQVLADRAEGLARAVAIVTELLALPDTMSREQVRSICDLAAAVVDPAGARGDLLAAPDWDRKRDVILAWASRGENLAALRDQLEAWHLDRLCGLPLERLLERFRAASRRPAPIRWWMIRGARAEVRMALGEGEPLPDAQVEEALETALRLRDETAALAAASATLSDLLADRFAGAWTVWAEVRALVEWVDETRALVAAVEDWAPPAPPCVRLRSLADAAGRSGAGTGDGAPGTEDLLHVVEAGDRFFAACGDVVARLDVDEDLAWGGPDLFGEVLRTTRAWSANMHRLGNWTRWNRDERAMAVLGLGALGEALRAGRLEVERLGEAFERSFNEWWIDRMRSESLAVMDFDGNDHDYRIKRFRDLDTSLVRTARPWIAFLAGPQGTTDSVSATLMPADELRFVRSAVSKKLRGISVRKLFERSGHALHTLKPCVLMSPLSVAQYLSADLPPFDLVVFDEASQIPPWDAMGAIARGKQVIVVGDSMQLPPTTFFQRHGSQADDDRHDDEDLADLESILEACRAAGMPRLSLGTHYRSKHESLIGFSNRKYYDHRLRTFPSAEMDVPHLGVKWRFVADGVYDKGGTRSNDREASALVAEVVQRLTDPDRYPGSVGIVTFSQAQQMLIEDKLDEARDEHPALEPFFADPDGGRELLFVKNLESVQGDERDVMFFSVGYGPDAARRLTMNFGPLNRVGGERRLNVAVTRARRQLVVYSSIHGSDIDLNRTRSVGVAHLKDFLAYAENGHGALGAVPPAKVSAPGDLALEETIRCELRRLGFEADVRVGLSPRCSVDVGVRDPERPGCYLLGILCDGFTYRSAPSARDRDRLRHLVLEGLGWQLHQVWSLDWWRDPEGQLEILEKTLHKASKNVRTSSECRSGSSQRTIPQPLRDEDRPVVAREDHLQSRGPRFELGEDAAEGGAAGVVVGEGEGMVQRQEVGVAHGEVAGEADGDVQIGEIDDVGAVRAPVSGSVDVGDQACEVVRVEGVGTGHGCSCRGEDPRVG